MRRTLFVLLLVLIPIQGQAAVVYFTGAEAATRFEFTQLDTGTHVSAQTGTIKNGAYAFQMDEASVNSAFGISKKGLALSTGWVGFWFREGTGSPTAIQNVARWLDAGQTHTLEVQQQTNGKLCFSLNSGACIATSTTALSANTWYFIEFKSVRHASAGGMELKINGTIEFTSLATDTTSLTTLDQVQFGPARNIASGPRSVFYDDLYISDSDYMGSSPKAIARQGAAGTPTYNAWTKNSCTGGVIAGCWSDTPFDTGKNATSSTASAAQTMLVSSFGSTQSGHGTEVIDAHDTVHACKVGVVAKTASAHNISVRRRIGGVDTDGTVALTTADSYVDPGLFTTTASVVIGATMEIGVAHDGGTTLDTVEDAWMQCYFTAANVVQRKVIQE